MKKISKLFLTVSLILFSLKLFAVQNVDPVAGIVNQKMADFMQENSISGAAVLLYVDGKPYSYYYGYANQQKKKPVTKSTIFEIGSISKVMTGLLLAQEIDSAKMQLDDPVTKFMKGLPKSFSDITMKSLATHVSGLPYNLPEKVKTEAELENYLKTWEPQTAPEDKWIYSNAGIGLLGEAIAKATHKNINQLYRSKILVPLQMQPIAFNVPSSLHRFYAQGYDKDDKPVSEVQPSIFAGAFGIKVSAKDMQHFLGAAIGLPGTPEQILYPMRMTQAAYVKLGNRMQGLGWQIHALNDKNIDYLLDEPQARQMSANIEEIDDKPTFRENVLLDKTGATDGFRSYIAVLPNKKSGIVILTNKGYAGDNHIAITGREILFKLTQLADEVDDNDNKKAVS